MYTGNVYQGLEIVKGGCPVYKAMYSKGWGLSKEGFQCIQAMERDGDRKMRVSSVYRQCSEG